MAGLFFGQGLFFGPVGGDREDDETKTRCCGAGCNRQCHHCSRDVRRKHRENETVYEHGQLAQPHSKPE
jgi:hypothetical protein